MSLFTPAYVKDINVSLKVKREGAELEKAKEACEKARKADSKLVTGTFKNIEAPGGSLEFAYRGHRGDPVRVYSFQDGKTYEIPLGVAKHINNDTRVPIIEYATNEKGEKQLFTRVAGYRQRYQFISQEYM